MYWKALCFLLLASSGYYTVFVRSERIPISPQNCICFLTEKEKGRVISPPCSCRRPAKKRSQKRRGITYRVKGHHLAGLTDSTSKVFWYSMWRIMTCRFGFVDVCKIKVQICLLILVKDQPSEMSRASTTSPACGWARTPTAGTADATCSRREAKTPGLLQNHPYRRGRTKVIINKSISTHTLYPVYKWEAVDHFCNQQATFQKSLEPFLRMSQRRRLRSSLRGPARSSSCSAAATTPARKSASTSQALLPPARLDKLNILSFSSFKDLKVFCSSSL